MRYLQPSACNVTEFKPYGRNALHFPKGSNYICRMTYVRLETRDFSHERLHMRNSQSTTWRDVVAAVLEDNGDLSLSQIYEKIDGHKKCRSNPHWKEKVRQVLQKYADFKPVSRGVWAMAG